MEQSSPTIQRDSKTITQPTFPEERTTPMLPEEYIQTAKSEALTLTAPMLEAQNSVRYQKLTAKKEDITGKDVFNSNRELLFTVSDSNPVVYMLMLSSRQIENENKGQYMQQLYLLVREHASQRVSALSKTYDPELDNKIRNLLLYNSLKKTSDIDTSLIQGAIQEGPREYFYPWVEPTIEGKTYRIDFQHMPLDKQTNKPIDITSFTPDEEGYQDFMEATGGFSQVPIHEQPTMKIPAIHA